jgi:hypothetical protein
MLDRTAEVKETKTLAAWTRAAQRALASDLPHTLVRRGDTVLVPSKSVDGKRYHVRLVDTRAGGCDCAAGLLGRPCTHRAATAIRLFEREHHLRVHWTRDVDPGLVARYLAGGAA